MPEAWLSSETLFFPPGTDRPLGALAPHRQTLSGAFCPSDRNPTFALSDTPKSIFGPM